MRAASGARLRRVARRVLQHGERTHDVVVFVGRCDVQVWARGRARRGRGNGPAAQPARGANRRRGRVGRRGVVRVPCKRRGGQPATAKDEQPLPHGGQLGARSGRLARCVRPLTAASRRVARRGRARARARGARRGRRRRSGVRERGVGAWEERRWHLGVQLLERWCRRERRVRGVPVGRARGVQQPYQVDELIGDDG